MRRAVNVSESRRAPSFPGRIAPMRLKSRRRGAQFIMSHQSLSSQDADGVRTSEKRPWWVAPEQEFRSDGAAPEISDDEHMVTLRVGRQASLGDFRIPQIPAVAAETLAMLEQAEPDSRQVSKVILRDQQLAADVIKFANSSLFAGVMDVSNIPQAISRVGFHRTRNLILAASMRATVYSACELDRAERLWRHSCGCAAVAARIARNLRCNPDDSYLAGLFHDVGKTIVLSLLDKEVLRSRPVSRRADFVDHVLDLYHEHVGAVVAREWRLPEHVVNAIRHHTENEGPLTKPQAIVALANNVCRRLNIGVTDDGRSIAGDALLEALGAAREDLGGVLEGVRELAKDL
jgi:putative nucleotidyltransferase with HDIG domain